MLLSARLSLPAIALLACTGLIAGQNSARADLIDPSTLHVGTGANTNCAGGATGSPSCPFAYQSQHLQALGGTDLSIYQNSNGAGALDNPILLIFAVPNDAGNALTSATVTTATLYQNYNTSSLTNVANPAAASITIGYGTTSYNISKAGFAGDMTSTKPDDVYSFLGGDLTAANNSNSFSNFVGADVALDPTLFPTAASISEFGIYVYTLTLAKGTFVDQSLIDIMTSQLPTGTFVLPFGETTSTDNKGNTTTTVYDSPFTQAGTVTGPGGGETLVPEPGTLAILASGLIGFSVVRRYRKRDRKLS